ncbi:unnamed protein product, partial [Allacma fusca]
KKLARTLYRTSGDVDLSLRRGLFTHAEDDELLYDDDEDLDNFTEGESYQSNTAGISGASADFASGSLQQEPTMAELEMTRTSTVKFQDGSDDDDVSINDNDSELTGFVRHNTPHPKDLKAKFQKWFGGAKPKPKNVDKVFVAPDENENSKGPFRPERQKIVETKETKEPYQQYHPHTTQANPPVSFKEKEEVQAESELEETDDQELTEQELALLEEKHVGFAVEDDDEEHDDNLDDQEKRNLKLQRRDTPHHLKNKRILTETADSDTIRAILQRAQNKTDEIESDSNEGTAPDVVDSSIPPKTIIEVLELTLNRDDGSPFGLNIAGGLGSSPFVDNDQSIFISKVVPGGLADQAGLKAGDRVVKVNGNDFTNIEHMAAVDTIRKAGNRIAFMVERKVVEQSTATRYGEPSSSISNLTTMPVGMASSVTIEDTKAQLHIRESAGTPTTDPHANSPSPNLIFPVPKSYKSSSSEAGAGSGLSTFDAMIPSEVKSPSAVVTVTIKQPDAVSKPVPELFLPSPTDLGTVTETITKSTLTETVFTRVTHNEALMIPVQTEDIVITKKRDESVGVKIVSGSEQDCFPFAPKDQPGVYVVHVANDGPAAAAGLEIGHRILEINGKMVDPTDKNKIALALLEAKDKLALRIRKHPPPLGFMAVNLHRAEGEALGMHIKGGVDNKGNPMDKDDSGIFISKIVPTGAIHRNGLLKVGMRIICVNGNPLLNVEHMDAVNVLRGAGSQIEMIVSNGYDPKEVDRLREEGKLPDKIVEILSNSEEAAAAAAAAAAATNENKEVVEATKTGTNPSIDKVMEVVKAAEQLVGVPSSPTGMLKDKSRVVAPNSITASGAPKSPTSFDVKKTTIVMTGHSLTSPSLGGIKKFPEVPACDDGRSKVIPEEPTIPSPVTPHKMSTMPQPDDPDPMYANISDLNSGKIHSSSEEIDLEFIDETETTAGNEKSTILQTNRDILARTSTSSVEFGLPVLNGNENNNLGVGGLPPLPNTKVQLRQKVIPSNLNLSYNKEHANVTPPPVPTPRTSLSSISGKPSSPVPKEEEQPKEVRVKIKELTTHGSANINLQLASEEDTDENEPPAVFQFSPEFHRVPSPIFINKAAVSQTFVTEEEDRRAKLGPRLSPLSSSRSGHFDVSQKPSTPGTGSSTSKPAEPVAVSTPKTVPSSLPSPSSTFTPSLSSSKEIASSSKIPVLVSSPTVSINSATPSLATVRSNMVSARAKFFEKEIEQLQYPVSKPSKQFSFLSQYEVDRMKQEEDQKIAAMGAMDHMRNNELEQVLEEEEYYADEAMDEIEEDIRELEEVAKGGSHIGEGDLRNVNVTPTSVNRASSGPIGSLSASSISSVSSTGSIRTAKAERRLKDRLSKEGVRFAEEIVGNTDLSPSEQRALQAEKRAAWRQARLKSLEQDALQAQMVLNRMSEIIDSPPPVETLAAKTNLNRSISPSVTVQQLTTTRTSTPDRLDNTTTRVSSEADQDNNVKIKIVETTEQKIISIELDSPSKSSVNSEEFSASAGMGSTRHATITSSSSTATSSSPPSLCNNGNNSSKRKKRKGSKKAKS